ncbi:hypothetical protein BC829DRAFT_386503 [Chytridium lagenaria]|nr:hypothetical protein BC829DRAFT_386503 [Chytridium lagenaria]
MRYIAWPFSSARWSTILRRHCRACACAILLQDSNLLQRPTSYPCPVWEWRRLSAAPSSRPHLDRDGITHEQANKENNFTCLSNEFHPKLQSKDDMITTITSQAPHFIAARPNSYISLPQLSPPLTLPPPSLQSARQKNPSYSFWAAFEYIWTDATLRPHLTQSDFEHLLLLVLRTEHPDRSTTLRTLRNRIRESPIQAVEYLIEIAKDAGDNINHYPDAHTISILISALANKGDAYAAIRIFWDLLTAPSMNLSKLADKAMAERILARWEGGSEWEVMTAAMEVFAVWAGKDILKEWSGISDRMVDAVTTLGCAHNIVLEALCRSRRFEEAREKYAYITQHQRLGRVRTYISHDLSSRLTNEDDRSLRRRSISLIGALMGVLRGKGRVKDVLQVFKGLGYIGKGEDAIRVVAIAVHAALDLGKLEAAKSFVKDMDGLKSMAMVVARERLREAIEKAA